jgi:hypothetical protein
LNISHIGSALLPSSRHTFLLQQLLRVPNICKNLISVSKFVKDNSVFFELYSSHFVIKDCKTQIPLHQGPLSNGLYQFQPSTIIMSTPQAMVGQRTTQAHWHCRLGHPAFRTVRHILSQFGLPVPVSSNKSAVLCSACLQSKSHQLAFPSSNFVLFRPLELNFSDVSGPSPTTSFHGNKYYVSFVDSFSRFTWLYLIQCKSNVYSLFIRF